MFVLVAFDDRRCVEGIAYAHQPAAKSRRPDLTAAVTHESPGASRKADSPLVLRGRMRGEPLQNLAGVRHPDRARGILGKALDVRRGRVDQLKDVLFPLINAGCSSRPESAGTILVQAEGLGAAVSLVFS